MTTILLADEVATGAPVQVAAGRFTLRVSGTFNGATLRLEMLGPDEVTWLPVEGGEFVEGDAQVRNLEICASQLRMAVGGGTPSGLRADLVPYVA